MPMLRIESTATCCDDRRVALVCMLDSILGAARSVVHARPDRRTHLAPHTPNMKEARGTDQAASRYFPIPIPAWSVTVDSERQAGVVQGRGAARPFRVNRRQRYGDRLTARDKLSVPIAERLLY